MEYLLLLLSFLSLFSPHLGEIKTSADLSLTFEGPALYLHQPNVAEEIGIWYKVDLNMYADMKQDYNLLLSKKTDILKAMKEFGYPKEDAEFVACRKQILEIEAKAKSAMIIVKKLEGFTDKGNIVGLELNASNTATIEIPAPRLLKEVNMHLNLLMESQSDWQAQSTSSTTTTTSAPTETASTATTLSKDTNTGRFRLLCSNLAQALDSTRHLVDILDVAFTHVNLLTNGKVPGTMLNAIDLLDNNSAGRFEFTEIDKCVKMQEGLKCILQSTSSADSLKIRKLYSLPFLVNEQVIQIDWESLQDPIVKADTLKIADKTGCHLTANRVNCPQKLVFDPNNCLEASVEGNVEKILKYCSFKHLDMQTEPFVYNFEGTTIVAQRNTEALTLKLSEERIFADPVKILHKDPLHISFNKNDTIIQGNIKIDEQEIITFRYNDSAKQQMALKSNTLQHFLQPFIPRKWEVILDMIGWALNVLGLILATKLTYEYVLKRCNGNNTDSNSVLPLCRRRLEIRNVKRMIRSGETLSEGQYRLALNRYCNCVNRRNDTGHRCPNIPMACYPTEIIPLQDSFRVRAPVHDNNIQFFSSQLAPWKYLFKQIYYAVLGFLGMVGKSIYLFFGYNPQRHKHVYVKLSAYLAFYRIRSAILFVIGTLRIDRQSRIELLDGLLKDRTRAMNLLIKQVKFERNLNRELGNDLMDLRTKHFTLKKQYAKLEASKAKVKVSNRVQATPVTRPRGMIKTNTGYSQHIQKKNCRATSSRNPKNSNANIDVIRQKSMPLTFTQELLVNDSSFMQTKNTILIKALENFLKAVRDYNINIAAHDRNTPSPSLTSIQPSGNVTSTTLEFFKKACKEKKIQPIGISVHIDSTHDMDLNGLRANEINNPNIMTVKGHPWQLRRFLPTSQMTIRLSNEKYMKQGIGKFELLIPFTKTYLTGQRCDYCLDVCKYPVDFQLYSLEQLKRYTFLCRPYDSDFFGLRKWTTKDRYIRMKVPCIKCNQTNCAHPLPRNVLSEQEEKSFFFECLIQKSKTNDSSKTSERKLTKEQLTQALKEVEMRLKKRKLKLKK
jgi:hypothetical protein